MRIAFPIRLIGSIAATAATVAQAAEAPKFAAPDAATSMPSGTTSGIGEVTVALLVVLAAIFAIAWFARRLRAATGAGSNGIEVLAQASLGAKERAVIVRVGEVRLLLGVAGGQVSLLHTLAKDDPVIPAPAAGSAPARPGFADLLKKSLGR